MLCRTPGHPRVNRLLRHLFLAASFLSWLLASACGDTCVFFKSDQNGAVGGVTVNGTTCPPQVAPQGTVQMRVGSAVVPLSSGSTNTVEHLYVTLKGIRARQRGTAGGAFSDWQDLAPELEERPAQIDLFESKGLAVIFEPSNVPAGVYRELRLRILNRPLRSVFPPEANRCGPASSNCVVFSDGTAEAIKPLGSAALDAEERAETELGIAPEQMIDGPLVVLPGGKRDFAIAFDATRSALLRTANGIYLSPAFQVRVSGESSDPLPGARP